MVIAKSTLIFFFKLAVSAALLVLVARGIDTHGVQTRIANAALHWLVAALMCEVLQVLLAARRWIVVTEILCGVRISMVRATGITAIGALAGQVLPSTVGGDVIRVGFVSNIVGIGLGTRSVIADRILGLLALSLVVIFSVGILAWSGLRHLALLIPAGLAIASLGAAAVLVAIAPWGERLPRILAVFAVPASDLRFLFCDRRGLGAVGMSVGGHLLSVGSFAALAMAISFEEVVLGTLALFVAPTLLLSAIPVSVGGWGIREGALSVGLGFIGVVGDGPVILSVLYGVTAIASSILASIFCFLPLERSSKMRV